MWILTVTLGLVIAYFILKFARVQTDSTYIPGRSYYKSGPTVNPSPLDEALIGVGLETRVVSDSVMDSGSVATMVMPPTVNSGPMSSAPSPMMDMSSAPSPMMAMSSAPSPMMAMGNAQVSMTPIPEVSPGV